MEKRDTDTNRRSRLLTSGRQGRGPVFYWMSRDQRVSDNWALLWAQQEAILHNKPLVVAFNLPFDEKATYRHYSFMLNSLGQLQQKLKELNIGFHFITGPPEKLLPTFINELDAHCLVTDFEPLQNKLHLQNTIIKKIQAPVYEVDTHNIIPTWVVSEKKEYAAYTIRPKINRLLSDYLTEIPQVKKHPFPYKQDAENIDVKKFLQKVPNTSVSELKKHLPGEKQALLVATTFIQNGLKNYSQYRNDPCQNAQSGLSPYLHFGHLSPQRLTLMVKESGLPPEQCGDFLEELIIRRELADNFCLYEPKYNSCLAFPNWSQKTLNEHRLDKREYLYTLEQLKNSETHEPLWNSCQRNLVTEGKLHGYLRMYWAKKILEWTPTPEQAMEYAIFLNDRYSLDGRDPNGYSGIAWSIGGVHDRAWAERPVFGKIRYMNAAGCRRKFDVDTYIRSVS